MASAKPGRAFCSKNPLRRTQQREVERCQLDAPHAVAGTGGTGRIGVVKRVDEMAAIRVGMAVDQSDVCHVSTLPRLLPDSDT
ncbi:hypothetical protein [Sphingomonas spermidinifaciens]|uniref:hypothetical protein n=1 Tax=Sphingomonas spermidinifaciens TaxID=1141889 RepID=UPI0031844CE1